MAFRTATKEKRMRIDRLASLTGLAVITLFLASPASALTMAECSTKYNAAKDAGTLGGQTWNQFRKAECGTAAGAAATDETKPAKKASKASAKADSANKTTAGDAPKGLTAKECSAKYQAAKQAGTLNGMKWNDFRKSECAAGASAAADDTKPAKTAKKASSAAPAGAEKGLSMAECSAKYQAAKAGNSLGGMKWNDFRKAQCGVGAADDDTAPNPTEAKYDKEPETPKVKAPNGVKFPSAISNKYSSETPGKARMHTCLDQYYANKDADALGGLKWIQKGGGFYSLCNARLKG
jgi:hypothetical protein